jgi:hypothetical protein
VTAQVAASQEGLRSMKFVIPEFLLRKGKAIPVISRESPYGCETSRLKDGGKVVTLRAGRPLPRRMIPGTRFC